MLLFTISKTKKDIYCMKSINFFSDMCIAEWLDGEEAVLYYKTLREHCPCAVCGGEKDVLGNIYGGQDNLKTTEGSIKIIKYNQIGHYGLQFWFSDGHKDGIFSFDVLKKLAGK